jgi:hypothetical protein
MTIFLVACQTEAAACLNHMLDYKVQRSLGLPGRLHHVGCHESEDDHHEVNQVVEDRGSVFASAEGRDNEEDSQPYDDLIPHEHACRAEDEGKEAGAIGFLLLHHLHGVVEYDVLWVDTTHISTIYKYTNSHRPIFSQQKYQNRASPVRRLIAPIEMNRLLPMFPCHIDSSDLEGTIKDVDLDQKNHQNSTKTVEMHDFGDCEAYQLFLFAE